MSARWLLTGLLALALLGQSVRAHHRLRSAQLVGQSQAQAAASDGRVAAPLARGIAQALAEAQRLDPVSIEPRAFAADLLLATGRHQQALAAYPAVAAHELRPETLLHWGLALDRSGDRAAAIRQWRRAVALAPRFGSSLPAGAEAAVAAAPLTPLAGDPLLAPTPRAR